MAVSFTVKRGDTLTLDCTRTDSAGNAVSLTGVTGAAKMRSRRGTEITLTFAVVSAPAGTFTLSATAAATATWETGAYLCDVEFTAGAVVASTDTFSVNVIGDIT